MSQTNLKTLALIAAKSHNNALCSQNIQNEKICLEFVRNLCILFLNEPDTNGKFTSFSSAFDFYTKLIPKLVFNDVIDKSQTQSFKDILCLLYTSPSPRDRTRSRMPSSA